MDECMGGWTDFTKCTEYVVVYWYGKEETEFEKRNGGVLMIFIPYTIILFIRWRIGASFL